jgi:hypothetical protein
MRRKHEEVSMTVLRLRYATIIGVCLLFALIVYAGPKDFWELKPYTEWNAKEVEKLLLKNSPWTQTLLIDASSGGGGGGGGGSKGSGGGGDGSAVSSTLIIINWFARPAREAAVRQLMLQNPNIPQQQIDGILNRGVQTLEMLVSGFSPASRGRGRGGSAASGDAELEKFKADTYLQKKNNEKIPLANVVVARNRNEATTLHFAREIDGKPTLTAEDQEITLVIRIADKVYKFKYKLANMVVKGKLEI